MLLACASLGLSAAQAQPPSPEAPKAAYFLTFEGAPSASFAALGFKSAVSGTLWEPGFRLLSTLALKGHDRRAASIRHATFHGGKSLVGYEIHANGLSVAAYLGASALHLGTQSPPPTRAARLRPAAMADIHYTWRGTSLPKFLDGSTTSLCLVLDDAERSRYLRLQHRIPLGWKSLALGPELSLSTGDGVRKRGLVFQNSWTKLRGGASLAGMSFGKAQVSLSAGMEHRLGRGADKTRNGAYGALTLVYSH